jgi:hypothetical protein
MKLLVLCQKVTFNDELVYGTYILMAMKAQTSLALLGRS